MSARIALRFAVVALVAGLTASGAAGYIHFPPMTLEKMCKQSHHVRVLKVTKRDKEKGGVVFEVAETLKGEKSQITSFKLVVRPDTEGAKKVLDWAEEGKTAVMFAIESKPGGPPMSIAYVFIDEYCYSADYNRDGKFWLLIRGEPGMSACYHGTAEKLPGLVKDVLAGKEVKVPTKEPTTKEDAEKRRTEINDVLKKNR